MTITDNCFIIKLVSNTTLPVDEKTALEVAEALEEHIFKKVWVTDLTGSRTAIILENVDIIFESTLASRQATREWNRSAQAEEKENRTWQDEDGG